jgi:hypothetical protein
MKVFFRKLKIMWQEEKKNVVITSFKLAHFAGHLLTCLKTMFEKVNFELAR